MPADASLSTVCRAVVHDDVRDLELGEHGDEHPGARERRHDVGQGACRPTGEQRASAGSAEPSSPANGEDGGSSRPGRGSSPEREAGGATAPLAAGRHITDARPRPAPAAG